MPHRTTSSTYAGSSSLAAGSWLRRSFWAFVLAQSLASVVVARDDELRFSRISLEQGLSQASVLSIVQDSRGFMWFTTMDGLNRYDGYTFTVYRPDPADSNSIADLGIRRVFGDRHGELWVVTMSGKLDRYDPERDAFIHTQIESPAATDPRATRVLAVVEDTSGCLWAGTGPGRLFRFDREKERFVQEQFRPEDERGLRDVHLQCMYADKMGAIWMGTWEGLFKYDCATKQLIRYKHSPRDPHSIGGNMVFGMTEDSGGNLWVATADGGVSVLNRTTGLFTVYRHSDREPTGLGSSRTMCVLSDSRSNIWVGTIDAGLALFQPHTNTFHHYRHDPSKSWSLGNGAVLSAYEDRSGGIWFGTSGGGISRLDPRR
ncbi:MAG: two-component regulator propeller domain-containing protein, partial [Bacteroidota bacterium]